MVTIKRLDYKQPRQFFTQVVEFQKNLASGESISWVTTKAKVIAGVASDAADLVSSVLASASTAKIVLQKGTHNNTYEIQVLASTSGGGVEEEELIVPVWEFNT